MIAYTVASSDENWKNLPIPAQEIHVLDASLDTGDTVDGLKAGLNMLEDSLLGLEVLLLGSIGELPGVGDLFEAFEEPLVDSIAGQEEVTVNKIDQLFDSALAPLVTAGILDHATTTTAADASACSCCCTRGAS